MIFFLLLYLFFGICSLILYCIICKYLYIDIKPKYLITWFISGPVGLLIVFYFRKRLKEDREFVKQKREELIDFSSTFHYFNPNSY